MSTVAVLVSTRIDPVSGRATRSSADAAAVAMALGLDPDAGLLAGGDMSEAVAREYLALGAPVLTRVAVAPGADVGAALAAAAATAPLLLCGARAQGGLGSGLLPYQVAAALGRPLVADVVEVRRDGDGWRLRQALPRGARRSLRVDRPAVLVLSERAPAATRHAFDAAQRGRIVTPPVAPVAPPRGVASPGWTAEAARRQLRPLAPRQQLSGHARMASAVGTGPVGAGGQVIKGHDVSAQARALFERLQALGLVAGATGQARPD